MLAQTDGGRFKLNFDGALLGNPGKSLGNPGKAGGGGLILESHGKWVTGYMRRNIGVATSIIAEFWAFRDGLLLASQLGITQLVVELDAKVIVDLVLSKNNRAYSPLSPANQGQPCVSGSG